MEKVIVEYGITRSPHLSDVTSEVNKMIGQGWQPFGSLTSASTYLDPNGKPCKADDPFALMIVSYAQAIVRYK